MYLPYWTIALWYVANVKKGWMLEQLLSLYNWEIKESKYLRNNYNIFTLSPQGGLLFNFPFERTTGSFNVASPLMDTLPSR